MQYITKLRPNEIFVFGSNTSGRHGKGAAKQAMLWGAVYGQAEGLQGRTYGIPTLNGSFQKLSLISIYRYVQNFIIFAKEHPELTFLVTDIGCGLAGFKHNEIAPMFKCALELDNVKLPSVFAVPNVLEDTNSYFPSGIAKLAEERLENLKGIKDTLESSLCTT